MKGQHRGQILEPPHSQNTNLESGSTQWPSDDLSPATGRTDRHTDASLLVQKWN